MQVHTVHVDTVKSVFNNYLLATRTTFKWPINRGDLIRQVSL